MSVISFLRDHCGYQSTQFIETVQSLWSGYGAIERWQCDQRALIVKRISPPNAISHPRGWHSDLSHRRKLQSYQIEQYWYREVRKEHSFSCYMPKLIASAETDAEQYLLLEDLQDSGFDCRVTAASVEQIGLAVSWLAQFHGRFVGASTKGLWPKGNYWHLDTRPDEWAAMDNPRLQRVASQIDAQLKGAEYQTLIHGDAKLANFGFRSDRAAAVDFQYVGGGVGIEDLAYFLGSCLDEQQLQQQAEYWLRCYFSGLADALTKRGIDPAPIEVEWRGLYDVAQADFARFLNGWAPQHWKLNGVLDRAVVATLARIDD